LPTQRRDLARGVERARGVAVEPIVGLLSFDVRDYDELL
jgi:hypothetical protein